MPHRTPRVGSVGSGVEFGVTILTLTGPPGPSSLFYSLLFRERQKVVVVRGTVGECRVKVENRGGRKRVVL